MKNPLTSNDGYTLLEVVVAIAIFSSVIFVASMGLYSVQQTWRKIHAHSRRLDNLLKIDRVVETSFRNIIPFAWLDDETKEELPLFYGDGKEVIFATLHRITDNNFNAIRFVHLYQEDDKLMVEYRNSPILERKPTELGLKREALALEIEELSFSYADLSETQDVVWVNDWDEDNNKNFMPLAVQITIVWKDGTKESWLRRTAGSGEFESYGVREINTGIGQAGATGDTDENMDEK